jgi:MFS transporter, OFA family, oxalate/formate antiporter
VTLGWRGAYLVLGGLAAAVGAGMALMIENDPRDRGSGPDGDALHSDARSARPAGASVRDAIRSRRFVVLYSACLICSFGAFVPFVHLVPYALDHGVPQASAVLLLGTIGVGSTAGRFLLGGLADRMGRQPSLIATFAGMALALAVWAFSTTLWPLAAFAFAYGAFYGGWVAVLPAVVMDHFGGRNVSGIIGILYTSVAFGTLIGPTAAGFAFDLSHSYTLPILAGVGANMLAAESTVTRVAVKAIGTPALLLKQDHVSRGTRGASHPTTAAPTAFSRHRSAAARSRWSCGYPFRRERRPWSRRSPGIGSSARGSAHRPCA